MNKRDFIAIALVLILTAATLPLFLMSGGEPGESITIKRNGEVYAVYPLSQDREIVIENGEKHNKLVIQNGEVFMEKANCPDGYCVKQGRISRAGESIVCLPNRIVAEVSADGGVDAVAR